MHLLILSDAPRLAQLYDTMKHELHSVESKIQSDEIFWSCPCGVSLELEFRISEASVCYPLDGIADSVTGGVTVPCPECRRQFFLPSMAVSPSVSEVVTKN